jgi:hypothetical protein
MRYSMGTAAPDWTTAEWEIWNMLEVPEGGTRGAAWTKMKAEEIPLALADWGTLKTDETAVADAGWSWTSSADHTIYTIPTSQAGPGRTAQWQNGAFQQDFRCKFSSDSDTKDSSTLRGSSAGLCGRYALHVKVLPHICQPSFLDLNATCLMCRTNLSAGP